MDMHGRKGSESSANAGGWRARRPLRGGKPTSNRKIQSVWSRLGSPRVLAGQVAAVAKRLRMAAVAAALVAAAGAATWFGYRFLTTSPRFAISTIEIDGNQKLSNAEIIAAMPLHLGENIFKADVARAEPVLRRLPWVAQVDVSRHLPNTIRVHVRERHAAAIAVFGDMYFIDANGRPFKRIDFAHDDIAELPILSGIARSEFNLSPTLVAERFRDALALMADWRSHAERPAIAEISLDHQAYTLRTVAGTTEIHLGGADGLALRLATFDAAWTALTTAEKSSAREFRLDYQPDQLTVAFAKD